jgi:hypothetical protein
MKISIEGNLHGLMNARELKSIGFLELTLLNIMGILEMFSGVFFYSKITQ